MAENERRELTLTGGTGAVLVTGVADVTNDIGIATTGTVTFGDTLVYGGDVVVDAGASAIAFNGTVDGPGDFELTTTNDITFGDDVGTVTRLGDVMLDPQHVTAGVFNVGSFTLVNGTGNVSFLGLATRRATSASIPTATLSAPMLGQTACSTRGRGP